MKTLTLSRLRLALIPATVALLAACASVPPSNPMLNEARALYQQASNDPSVARSAPLELSRAQASLQRAESALKAGEDVEVVEHHAYLARQRAAVAMQAGVVARSQAAVSDSRSQRERILMDSRSREADARRLEAEAQTLAAQKARAEAEQALKQAQDANKLAAERLAVAEATKARNDKLRAQLAELEAKQTDRGMVLTLGDVLFDTGRAQLKAGAMRTIDRLAVFMRENPERTVAVEGYTDSVGSDAYNQSLSQRRAQSVQLALSERGIASNRVTTTGFGEASPVASNDTAEGRQRNRRVEVVISDTK